MSSPSSPLQPPSSSEAIPVARVGTPQGVLPGPEAADRGQEITADSVSQWWTENPPGAKPAAIDSSDAGRTPLWNTSAGDERSRFRHIPVVGRLPWRGQYTIALTLLALPLAALLVLVSLLGQEGDAAARQAAADLGVRQALLSLSSVRAAEAGTADSDAARRQAFVTQGRAAIDDFAATALPAQRNAVTELGSQWQDLQSAIEAAAVRGAALSGAEAAAVDLQAALTEVLPKMNTAVQAAGVSMPADLAETTANLTEWRDAAQQAATGAPIPERLIAGRTRIEQLLRAFASSPEAQNPGPVTQSWRWLGSVWARIQPRMDVLIQQRQAVAAVRADADRIGSAMAAVHQTLTTLAATALAGQAGRAALRRSAWAAGGLAAGALVLLLFVGWKQQRLQALDARAHQEEVEAALAELTQDLTEVASGDLTRSSRVTATPAGALAESLNKAVGRLRRLVVRVKRTVEETSAASMQAGEATGLLVDETRSRAQALEATGELIMRLGGSVRQGADDSRAAVRMVSTLRARADQGAEAVEEAKGRAQTLRTRMDESRTRARRVVVGTSDQKRTAETVGELAEEAKVLASSASLQAAKAGAAGLPFQRIAKSLLDLSGHLERAADRLVSQSATAYADADTLSGALDGAVSDLDDGARLSDVAHESMRSVAEQMRDLNETIASVGERAQNQESIASNLEDVTRQDLARTAESRRQAQQAADAIMTLVGAVRVLGENTQKIRS